MRVPLLNRDGEIVAHATIDSQDAAVAGYRWHLSSWGYARRSWGPWNARQFTTMHRQIMGLAPGDGLLVDHVNGDKLDNRRANLRLADKSGNSQNEHAARGGSSQFRGVSWHASKNRWRATAVVRGRQHHIGYFNTEEEAAAAAAAFRARHMPFSGDARKREMRNEQRRTPV